MQRSLKASDLLILYKATNCLTSREGEVGSREGKEGKRGGGGGGGVAGSVLMNKPINISIKRLESCTGTKTGAQVVQNV